ncbi:uncharacterized protein HD556DRAFT_1446970 [Suillus plorans]|uniref:hAT-like transposase RNase-H fold domain-containing protein n=1 Tax=Suillus plorans TaxID=116603 RepID=A0A9P7DE72_9AGAM|nr:uncharacterized protein HD556DRAFT_1446970 [Suillus plorans]KAG1789354.1 hypothetical protein HD556DRAFT_1446970 [Suillus plorans]
MPVRWSSTYVMLNRVEKMKPFVNTFVYELGVREPNLAKRAKIDHVLCADMSLLSLTSFSSDKGSTLQLALPALKALHKAWMSHSESSKYEPFHTALNAAVEKICGYYERTADNDAYIMAMLLDPSQKDSHIKHFWGKETHIDALREAERMVSLSSC